MARTSQPTPSSQTFQVGVNHVSMYPQLKPKSKILDKDSKISFLVNHTDQSLVNLGTYYDLSSLSDRALLHTLQSFLINHNVWNEDDFINCNQRQWFFCPRNFEDVSYMLRLYEYERLKESESKGKPSH